MAYFSPEEAFDSLKDRTAQTVKDYFPLKGTKNTLVAKKVWVEDDKDTDDIHGQQDARLKNRTWAVPVKAQLELHNENGKVIDSHTVTVAQLPKVTRRYTHIVDGNEWQVSNQFRLKSGVYTRIKDNGDLSAQWNLAKGRGFNMDFDPASRMMKLKYGTANIPLYPVLKTMGVSDDEIKKSWGKEIFEANQKSNSDQAVRQMHKTITGRPTSDPNEARNTIAQEFEKTELRPESTKTTLGQPFKKVDGFSLLAGADKLLKVARREVEPDDRDSLEFKELWSAEDLIQERLAKDARRDIVRRMTNNIDRRDKVNDIVGPDIFGRPLKQFFTSSSLAERPDHRNPIGFIDGARKTTLLGQHGIDSPRKLTLEAQSINPSHLGFLDPVKTPECYDRETEVFTFKGWKCWENVSEKDLLACRIDGRLEFHVPSRIVRERYKGLMYGLKSSRTDYLVTPNHRHFFSTPWRPDVWRFDTADRVHGKERSFTGKHEPYVCESSSSEMWELPPIDRTGNALKLHGAIPMLDWAEFMGWYLTEGCVTYNEETSAYLVRISQNAEANPENWERLRTFLSRTPFSWSFDSPKTSWATNSKQLAHYLKEFGFCYDKFIPEYFFKASVEVREILLETLLLGDGRLGSERANGRSYRQQVFTTTSPRLADDFERLAIGLGLAVTHKIYPDNREERYLDVHEVRLLQSSGTYVVHPRHPTYPAEYYTVDYDGMVYCATVPGGLLLIRRHGGVGFWSGNSERIGAVLQLSANAQKIGKDIRIPVYDARTGKKVLIDPTQALRSNLAFPDQYERRGGKFVPVGKDIKITDSNGDITMANAKDVRYILPSAKGMFDVGTNLIPFLQNDQGNRTMMASRQLEQAVPLIHREKPLVQTAGETGGTFEDAVGRFSSHKSKTSGTVIAVTKDGVKVKDLRGKVHEVQLYNDFPLNDNRSVINSHSLVKVGDKITAGQTVADSSFTKGGVLALGTNLRTAYMPYKGLNFEDGVVISESASKKLTSEHLHRESIRQEDNVTLNKKKFLAETAGQLTKIQADKLDEDGVVKPGTLIEPGDVLIGQLKKEELTPEQKQLALFSRKAAKPMRAYPISWEKDYTGTVSRVVKHGKDVTVYIKSENPAEVGDKVVGRHGNKGIVTAILADHEMPHTKDGRATEILMNPTGVPTRTNLGQVLETGAAKIAEKTGKPYIVNNFDPKVKNYTRKVMDELDHHGISDTEEMIDPKTGKSYGQVLVGPQYMTKLYHVVDKKLASRSREGYTQNLTPQGGGSHGGQTLDIGGLYALLAHGARHNILEAQTYKSEMNDEVWNRIQTGEAIPAPQTPFVYKKFESYLKGAGIDVRKEGNQLVLQPLTDKGVLKLSNGEIKDPGKVLRAKDAHPEKGGLFDPLVTGTQWPKGKLGDKWSHITLAERMPNPVFEKPVRVLTGLTETEFNDVMAGKKTLGKQTSAKAIITSLKNIDVNASLKDLEKKTPSLRGAELDKANQKMRYLRALKEAGLEPHEAYTMQHVAVLPPNMRPISVLPNGSLNEADLNGLYSRAIGANNSQLKELKANKLMPEDEHHPVVESLYDGLKALTLTGMTFKNRYRSGLIEQVSGGKGGGPKEGFFQDKVIGRRQDMSMRSTIVPDPSLNLDEVALPRKAAAEMYKPFVVARMRRMGFTPLEAQKAIKENTPTAQRALELEVQERPVLLKRDPVLHKYGVQAFKPILSPGKTIKIHPLVTSGFNADFDGDTMSAFVPVSPKAVEEAHKMFPSNNLFSSSTADIMYKPGHESMQGLFKMSEVTGKGVAFNTIADAARAVKEGKIKMTDRVNIKSMGGPALVQDLLKTAAKKHTSTTVGRILLSQTLPDEMKEDRDRIVNDMSFMMNKGNISDVLTTVGHNHQPKFSETADKMKNLGNEYATGMSIGLKDFLAHTEDRDAVLKGTEPRASAIRRGNLPRVEKDKALVDLYSKADKEIQARVRPKIDRSENRMYDWVKSGARGDWDQYRQMAIAPMLVVDSKSKTVPVPITKSYGEGLDIASYWTSMHGARMGTIGRVQGTEMPGALFKEVVNTSINQVVASDDCGTSRGVAFDVNDKHAIDRYTATDVKIGTRGGKDKGLIPAGTLVTPRVLTRLKNNGVKEVTVRTPLKCSHGEGICAKCMGLNEHGKPFEKGTNVGVIAAQALGEPATQLAMNAFHTGGVSGAVGSNAVDKFTRLKNLLELPETLKDSATLAHGEGKVSKIEKDPAGGWGVYIGDQKHFVPARRELAVKIGQAIKKGDAISSGVKNPREMLPLTGLSSVQRYLTDEITKVYSKSTPLHRRNAEVVVRAITNLSEVTDDGSNGEFFRGDYAPTSVLNSYNSGLKAGERQIKHTPVLKGVNIMPIEMQTDWLARMHTTRLKDTLLEGAAKGWKANLHGPHPIPGMAWGKEFGVGTKDAPWLY